MASPEPTNQWPKTETVNGAVLTFSGTFNANRLLHESSHRVLKRITRVLHILIILFGLASLGWSIWLSWQYKNISPLLTRSPFNMAFWIGVFLLCYLWAETKQHKLNQQRVNLLQWNATDNTERLDIYEFFNDQAKACWNKAALAARNRSLGQPGQTFVVSGTDLMLALLEDRDVKNLFYRLGTDPADLKLFLRNYERLADGAALHELDEIPFTAFNESLKLHNKTVDPLMLLCALKIELSEDHVLQGVFFNLDVTLEDLEIVCSWIFGLELLREQIQFAKKLYQFKPTGSNNRGLTALPTPYLDRFSKDLTLLARYGRLPLALGRGQDLLNLFTLFSNEKKSLVIKGPSGTGRVTLIHELAYKMAAEQVPVSLSDMRLMQLEISAILGNGQRAEQVLETALEEAGRADNIVLVIPDIQELARTQTSSGITLLEILTDFIQNNRLVVFATTTNEDYTDYLRPTPNFDTAFNTYELRKLSRQEILLACCVKASLLEYKNKCLFRYPAIRQAVELTDLYIKNTNQPQKAIAVLVEAASRSQAEKNRVISSGLIQTIMSEKTHIPSRALSQDESIKLLNLEQELSKYIIGQSAALTAVAEGLRRARSGLAAEGRPLGSFLFLGPTGVGKTEVAKALAKIYFDDLFDTNQGRPDQRRTDEEKYLLRLDMSEYQGDQALEKLIGSENTRTDAPLVKHLKNYPFCLLLCDEFEKASPEVLNLFLQILEDGRLTSGKGETLDVTHALVIATSNAGSGEIQIGLKGGETLDKIKSRLLDQLLLKYYPPELLNRFDDVIVFSTLSQEDVTAIVHLQLESLKAQLLAKGIKVNFSLDLAKDIAEKAYDPSLGARPVRRYIQDHVESFIAKLILQKRLERGSELNIDIKNDRLTIN